MDVSQGYYRVEKKTKKLCIYMIIMDYVEERVSLLRITALIEQYGEYPISVKRSRSDFRAKYMFDDSPLKLKVN